MERHRLFAIAAATIGITALPVLLMAQTPAPTPATAAPAVGAPAPASSKAPTTPAPPVPEAYSYEPAGRRDPFVSLVARGIDASAISGKRSDGLGGLSTGDVVMSGVLQSQGTYVALLRAPDGKTFPAHVNDKLADGTIRSINAQGMVIMQDVTDPLSLVKVKEVRKGLRASDDVKQ